MLRGNFASDFGTGIGVGAGKQPFYVVFLKRLFHAGHPVSDLILKEL
jgi:hypothetical protein